MKWTPEAEKDLRERWVAGYSAAEIGADIGLTRSGVLGKLSRMGLAGIDRQNLSPRQVGGCIAQGRRASRIAAETINAYWADRGFNANARAVQVDDGVWEVQSDLVNGLPQEMAA